MILILAVAPAIWSQTYAPVPGGELLDRFRSPLFLAGTENTASTESVSGDVVNPAASALKQRVHLDVSYAAIVGDGAWDGHTANLGTSIPTPVGVFSGSLNFAQARYEALDLGQRGSLNLSFAKDLYPSLLFGAGLRGHLGSGGGTTDVAGGLDLGLIHILGPLGPVPELRWGVALTQLGVGLNPRSGTTGSPAPFTLGADLQATLVDTAAINWTAHTGFSLPSFQNLRFRAGSTLTAFDRIGLTVGWDVDLRERSDGDRTDGSLLPSVGLTVRMQTGRGASAGDENTSGGSAAGEDARPWSRSDVAIHSAWAPLYPNVWAAGAGANIALGVIDRNAPAMEVSYPETEYVSPNNDGAADEFLLPVSISDERYVTSWSLEISDSEGTVVRHIENKEQRPENAGFRNIIDRLLYVEKGVQIPEEIRWDGRTDEGGVAPDGSYTFVVRAVDDNGNARVSEPRELVVDATPPQPSIVEPEQADALIFSPNDDGNKDVLTIEQDSTPEDVWTLQILDSADTVVYEETVEDTALSSFTWDGTDNQGTLVPDGVYSYRVASQDRALNEGTARLNNIIVDTEPTPIGLATDLGAFSPNDDGRQDSVLLTPDVPVTEGIREYSYRVTDAAGSVVRTRTGGEGAPAPWRFDGRGDDGSVLAEGSYTVTLELVYRNGNRPQAVSPPLQLDVTPPRLAVNASTPVFSPNGDGRLDTVSFVQETERVPSWQAEILGPDDSSIRSFSWSGRPDPELVWDGRTAAGERAPDGDYRYVLTGQDRAGNRRVSDAVTVALDTRETPVFVSSSRPAFSPDGDGSADTIDLIPQLQDSRGVERFDMELVDDSGAVVARISDSGLPRATYAWDGRGATGQVVPDGDYAVRLTVQYRHGNRPQATSAPFTVDTRDPSATVTAADTIFSPDGDGDKDTITIDQTSSAETRWTASVVPADGGTAVRTWQFSGELAPLTWDGTDNDGQIVADGRYLYRVGTTDEAGNSVSATTRPFRIDTRAVDVQLRLGAAAFSPNGDGIQDSVPVLPAVNIDTPIQSWTVTMERADSGEPVWSHRQDGDLQDLIWDGRSDSGNRAGDDTYRARLNVTFARGDTVTVASARTVTLDTQPPRADVTFSSDIISPNGDGNLDELRITQRTSEEPRWTARVLNASDREVGRWEWVGQAPEQVSFAGLDTARRRVPDGIYRYELHATDEAGNSTTVGPRPFEIYTAETPVEMYASDPAFSPNGDGTLDSVEFPVIVGPAEGLQRYTFTIRDAAGTVVRTETGTSLPDRIPWTGTDDTGARVAEGSYRATLQLEYRHGNRPTAESGPVDLDVTPPDLAVNPSHTVFSPDGDGRRDAVTIQQTSDEAPQWNARITGVDGGEVIREFSWTGRAETLSWDGTDAAGNVVPDGTYRYAISGADAAGNTASATVSALRVDTRPTRLFVTLDRRTVSPNGDGVDDSLTIRTIARRQDGAEYGLVEILDSAGVVVRQFRSDAVREQNTVVWNGAGTDGSLPDGEYFVRYRVAYDNGALGETVSPAVTLDTSGPRMDVELRGLPFSPDNDGQNDELDIALTVEDRSSIASWTFEILDRNRRPFQEFTGTGQPRNEIRWDGRSSTGELVISAEDYPYRFTAVDSTGNRSTVEGEIPIDILVVRDGDLLKVQISNINFAPNSPALELDPDTEEGRKNLAVLDRLVEVFDKYRSYSIRVEGHAVNISGTEREQREELLPLSTSRAETVRQALIDRGMDPDRISIVGRGGSDPIVPHTDLENRWKNRRVEFILIR